MEWKNAPNWLVSLSEEEMEFIKKFLLGSDGTENIAQNRDLSELTVKNQLSNIKEKIKHNQVKANESVDSREKSASLKNRISITDISPLISYMADESGCTACSGTGLLADDEGWQYHCVFCKGTGKFSEELDYQSQRLQGVLNR